MRPAPSCQLLTSTVLLLLASAAAAQAAADRPVPGRLGISVRYGEPRGPEALREELERELLAAVERAGCVQQVMLGAPPDPHQQGELLFEMVLQGLEEVIEYDSSLAERVSPDAMPQAEHALLARIRARISFELRALTPPRSLKSRRLQRESSSRPIFQEDARELARAQFVEDLVRSAAAFVCKNSRLRPARAR